MLRSRDGETIAPHIIGDAVCTDLPRMQACPPRLIQRSPILLETLVKAAVNAVCSLQPPQGIGGIEQPSFQVCAGRAHFR
jgi:hypothetical protein